MWPSDNIWTLVTIYHIFIVHSLYYRKEKKVIDASQSEAFEKREIAALYKILIFFGRSHSGSGKGGTFDLLPKPYQI